MIAIYDFSLGKLTMQETRSPEFHPQKSSCRECEMGGLICLTILEPVLSLLMHEPAAFSFIGGGGGTPQWGCTKENIYEWSRLSACSNPVLFHDSRCPEGTAVRVPHAAREARERGGCQPGLGLRGLEDKDLGCFVCVHKPMSAYASINSPEIGLPFQFSNKWFVY